jgi:hypothetical protein
MDKNSNHTDANKFFEREMEYHMYYLSEKKLFEKWWWSNLKNNWFSWKTVKLVWEKVSLKLWYRISEFWNNWILPIVLILLLSLLVVIIFYLYDNFNDISIPLSNTSNNIIENLESNNIIKSLETHTRLGLVLLYILVTLPQVLLYFLVTSLIFIFYKYILKIGLVITIIWVSLYIEYYTDHSIIKNFLEFLYPFHWLLDYKSLKELPIFKLFIFILFKLIYAILIWHLVVALKRTTRR